ncbi:MAG: hypothetical protein PHY99_07035, partial [Bacteroidales bacterium]|nr:hypothetical protein [Bacteroidales bacterium]
MEINKRNKYILILIPILYVVWSLQLNHLGGPFFMNRSDPEYPFLLNGLNCSLFQFHNIGHTDHPGTPMQMLTGLIIRITHILVGQDTVVQDVLSRPELYLASCSLFLTLLTFVVLLWVGRVAMRNDGRITGSLILQSTFFLSTILIDLQLRYTPDRIMVIYNLILAGLTMKYLFTENYDSWKYAILAGILMGISVATKFNYLPVLAIPFLIVPGLRNKIIYGITTIAAFFVGILPIIDKFYLFKNFLKNLVIHDGMYGGGSQQMINWQSLGKNTVNLLKENPTFAIILILAIGLVVYYLLNRKKLQKSDRYYLALSGFILAACLGFLLVSKQYKVVYFVPVLGLSGLALYMIWMTSGIQFKWNRMHSYVSSGALAVLIFLAVMPMPANYRSRIAQKQAAMKTRQFYEDHVTKKDLMFIQPTWIAGPMTENALSYGISYVAERYEFYNDYHKLYPNVITWEAEGQKPRLFRAADIDPESFLYCGKDIYVYATPGRNADWLTNYLDTLAARSGVSISKDTVFVNPDNEERVIRVRNNTGWTTLT